MDKRQSVIESIQKLLALNVSDNEIADNLFDVGISKQEASELIREAKGVNSVPSTPQTNSVPVQNKPVDSKAIDSSKTIKVQASQDKSSKAVFDETVTKLSMNDQVISQIPFVKQSPEKKDEKGSKKEIGDDDVENNIIGDVQKQSSPEEVGEENDVEDSDALSEEIGDDEVESSTEKKLTPTVSINDEENEDEFESRVKKVLELAKKNNSQQQAELNKIPKSSFEQTPTPQVKETPVYQTPLSSQKASSFTPTNMYAKTQSSKVSFDSSPDFEELWKKGIVVAVNAKLAEMKQLKDDVDLEINQKVDEAIRKELYQFKVLNESQKDLLVSSNKEALDSKQKEITFIIDSKIAELKQYNKQLSDTLKAIEDSKKQQELSVAEIKSVLEEAKKTKAQLLIEVNSELIKTKSQAQAFLDSAATHLNQMDERVNKTLELERNIAEGMLTAAEQKIEQLAITRADELIEKMEVELNKLESTNKKISPQVLDDKIKTIEKFRTEFITNMQSSLSQINSAIEELNKKNEFAQSTLEEKTLAIDAKMEELTKFEKQFTQIMDNILSK